MSNIPSYRLKTILAKYGLNLKRVALETSKEKKEVWWVDTDAQNYVLKKMPVDKDRLLFLFAAVEHLSARGVNIPEISRTLDGNLFVKDGGDIYILMEAIIGKTPKYDDPRDLAKIIEGLAAFHQASKNFHPPSGVKVRSHLGTWDEKYGRTVADLEDLKVIASNSEDAFGRFYLNHCDYFIAEAKTCLELLKNRAYTDWLNKVRQESNLCHQDFAAGNLGLVNGKLYIYDLDSITVDLPARDLRKILNKVMKKRGQWDMDLVRQMLGYYQKVNPLTPAEYGVVFTDLRFPHLFWGIANKYFTNREKEWSPAKYLRRLQEMTRVEKSKDNIIKHQREIIRSLD